MTLEELRQKLASFKNPAPDFQAAIRYLRHDQQFDCMVYEVDGYVVEDL